MSENFWISVISDLTLLASGFFAYRHGITETRQVKQALNGAHALLQARIDKMQNLFREKIALMPDGEAKTRFLEEIKDI